MALFKEFLFVMLLTSWLRRVWHWLAEIPTFWAFLAVLVIAVCIPLLLVASTDDAMRYAGLLLQLVGVGVVAYTLRGRGKLFGRAPVITFTRQWILRVPRFRPRNIILEASGSAMASASATADATVWRGPRLDQSIDAQLEAIRENLTTLQRQVEAQNLLTNTRIADLRNAIDVERTQRSAQIHETKKTLEGLAADSLYIEVAGISWLVSGIVLATIPNEIAVFLRWLTH